MSKPTIKITLSSKNITISRFLEIFHKKINFYLNKFNGVANAKASIEKNILLHEAYLMHKFLGHLFSFDDTSFFSRREEKKCVREGTLCAAEGTCFQSYV